ncbi:flagellar motor switch protein FliN [Chitinivibrio alkaliphilus]|uniref:Flagellar motor switch protein FliN n=1 Tax=Chitinivibrio alkaliphilus ACht1 TaxID=1313304 RepID=U7D6D1_9BACT|nr:flagellar motor switch protein FliN [Chitinivibrio alkaliphilus]ERP32074.1 flagellar motor switch protein FliN [Chitinivibrio alkaliphilus ACht1]
MSDFLSQDDIDALLQSEEVSGGSSSGGGDALEAIVADFNSQQGSVIKTLIGKEITFTFEEKVDSEEGAQLFENTEYLGIDIPFTGAVEGTATLYMSKKHVATFADLMVMGDGAAPYNAEEHNDAIKELYSAVAGGYTTDLGGKADGSVNYDTIEIQDGDTTLDLPAATAKISVTIETGDPFYILLAMDTSLHGQLNELYGGSSENLEEEEEEASAPRNRPFDDDDDLLSQDELDSLTTASSSLSGGYETSEPTPQKPRVKPASQKNIDMLLDIDLDIAIELGKTEISIKRVLDMAPGSMVELDSFAGEPVNLLVNNKVVAKGEVVVVDENFGVRIISLVSPEERIKSLR